MGDIPKKHEQRARAEREQRESRAGSGPFVVPQGGAAAAQVVLRLLRGPCSSSELSRCALSLRAAQRGSRGQCSAHVPCALAGRQAGNAVACRASFTGDASSGSVTNQKAAVRPAGRRATSAAAAAQPAGSQADKPSGNVAAASTAPIARSSGLLARRELWQRSRSARMPRGRFPPPPLFAESCAEARAERVFKASGRGMPAGKPEPR